MEIGQTGEPIGKGEDHNDDSSGDVPGIPSDGEAKISGEEIVPEDTQASEEVGQASEVRVNSIAVLSTTENPLIVLKVVDDVPASQEMKGQENSPDKVRVFIYFAMKLK